MSENFKYVWLDFSNDESIVQYQEIVGKLFAGFAPMFEKASEPIVFAK
jgi:hypothetical protein